LVRWHNTFFKFIKRANDHDVIPNNSLIELEKTSVKFNSPHMVDGRGLRFNIWMVDHLAAGLYIFIGEPEHTSLIKIHKLLTNFVIYSNKTNTIKKKRELKLNCRGKAIDKKRIKMKSRKLRHSIHFLG